HVIAYDPFVSAERFRELGIERVEATADVYAAAEFVTLHLPLTSETRGSLDAAAFARMRDGVRLVNAARGELVDEAALLDALGSGKVAGAPARPRRRPRGPSSSTRPHCSTRWAPARSPAQLSTSSRRSRTRGRCSSSTTSCSRHISRRRPTRRRTGPA